MITLERIARDLPGFARRHRKYPVDLCSRALEHESTFILLTKELGLISFIKEAGGLTLL